MMAIPYYTSSVSTLYTMPKVRYVDFKRNERINPNVLFAKTNEGKWHYVFLDKSTGLNGYPSPMDHKYIEDKIDSTVMVRMINNDVCNYWPSDFTKDLLEFLLKNT